MSLDGYGAAEGWAGYWGMEGPEYLRWLEGSREKHDTLLMGANTYRLMSNLADSGGEGGIARLTAASKVVFSTTLEAPLAWATHA